jgi:hypothetical protein
MSGLQKRLAKLRAALKTDCPGGVTVILDHEPGQPKPAIPDDAARCELCGEPHVLFIEEVITTSEETIAP